MNDDSSTKHVLEGRELIDYLVEKTSSTANAELLRREERRNRRMTILLSILTAVGIGGAVGAVKMLIKDQMHSLHAQVDTMYQDIEQHVDTRTDMLEANFAEQVAVAVEKQVEVKLGEVRTMFEQYKLYQEMLAIAEIIKVDVSNDKFPEEQLMKIQELLEQLADAESIISQPHFLEAIKIVMDLLVRTDRNTEIDNLEQLFRQVLVTDSKVALDLTDHYGQVIISSPYPVEKLQNEFEALTRYARTSRELNYPEKALMWELFVAYKRSQYVPNATTNGMVEMVQDLNDADTRNFCYHMFLNSHPLHWMNKPDQEGRELARLVTSLLDNYAGLRQLIETQIATPELRPSIEKLVARKTERLARLQPEPEQQAPSQTAEAPDVGEDNTLRQ